MFKFRTFRELVTRSRGHITVACDTEFKGPHTLTIQFAARLGDVVIVQMYSSPGIPAQPKGAKLKRLFPPEFARLGQKVVIRDGLPITPDLSPVCVLCDLFGVHAEWMDRVKRDGADNLEPPLTLTLVGHFWPADFFRVFGRDFFTSLVKYQIQGGQLVIQGRRHLSFKEGSGCRFRDPILGYALAGESLYPIRVRYFDTCLTFGKGSLDEHARTFVGVGKLDVGKAEKADMLKTFRRKSRRAYAYAYAALDPVLTLLVKERMADINDEMYRALGLGEDIPALRSTQGSRVAEMGVRAVAKAATGSVLLSCKSRGLSDGEAGKVSLAKVKGLLYQGSGDAIAGEGQSEFGEQTGHTHGGLLFSRSPTQFYHEAPGMLRDVDLSGCYAHVMGSMSLYVGRPVIHEPGSGRMTLKDAVAFAQEHAAGQDAWIVKVSGKINTGPNVLIPSTRNALTNANYKSRAAKRRAQQGRYGFAFDRADAAGKDEGNTAIYTDVIEAGVVAWPTWLIIRAMPPERRAEYENLEVDTILFYPRVLVADSGPAFDALVKKHRREGTPWTALIDMAALRQVIERRIDDEYVSLRFDLGGLARALQELRKRAREQHGEGSAAEKGYKEQVNTLYGTVASRHLPTNNVVAANYITATARALAFALQLSLNGVQVITDSCTCRRDQVPARPFADCLAACGDYPINRAEFAGPFVDPTEIPEDDAAFTTWYRGHVKRFFGVDGPDYDALFSMHPLQHKVCGGCAFDALCCDGASNYVKLQREGDGWGVAGGVKEGFKARSFQEEAKTALADWLCRVYREDRYDGPPPITESSDLLTYKAAGGAARTVLRGLEAVRAIDAASDLEILSEFEAWRDPAKPKVRMADPPPATVYYPLGLDRRRVQAYKLIKPSAFLFRTPEKQRAWLRAMKKFEDATSCGLELLSLRRGVGGRRKESVADVALAVYRLIRSGEMNPTKRLNLTRTFNELEAAKAGHHQELQDRQSDACVGLALQIDRRLMDDNAVLTGLFVRHEDIARLV